MSDDNSSEQHNEVNNQAPQSEPAATPVAQPAATAQDADGVGEHKLFAILGYILPFLFFIPLVQDSSKHNPFARFHANQQLILLALWVGLYLLSNVFYMMFISAAFVLMPLMNLALLVLAIMGIINAAQGEMKGLPVVGNFKLIDKMFK